MKKALITGGAGFIGSHLVDLLMSEGGWHVTVVDNFDPFYDPGMKLRSIASYLSSQDFSLVEEDIRNLEGLSEKLSGDYDVIVHLAAKAGVRPSINDPVTYCDVNIRGTQNMLELCKEWGVKQFVFASSSSVYGMNPNVPWNEDDNVLLPVSPYASTKVSGELLGHVYSHLYGIRFVALRFFTVYGPRQRPDLAIHVFTKRMLQGRPISFYGDGSTSRDYTYVRDIVTGIRSAMEYTDTMYEIINLGNNRTVSLAELVEILEDVLGRRAIVEQLPPQLGDVPRTWANVRKAAELLGYRPTTALKDGLKRFVEWVNNERAMA